MLPKNRAPTHPGEMLLEEFLKPLNMTQTELAGRIHVSYPRINEIINGRRGVTPDTALRLSRLFGTTPEFWLNGQRNELWHRCDHRPQSISSENQAGICLIVSPTAG